MERIGITASKMSQGHLPAYNFFVVLISTLVSLLIFVISGSCVLLVIFLVSLVLRLLMPTDFQGTWFSLAKICLIVLGIILSCLNAWAIFRNIKLTKQKI